MGTEDAMKYSDGMRVDDWFRKWRFEFISSQCGVVPIFGHVFPVLVSSSDV